MTQAAISSSIFSDVAFLGIRASIGIIFLLHGLSKLGNEMYIGWMSSLGISPEFATIIAIGEIVPGILLFVGVLSRLSAGVLAAVGITLVIFIKIRPSLQISALVSAAETLGVLDPGYFIIKDPSQHFPLLTHVIVGGVLLYIVRSWNMEIKSEYAGA